MILIKEFQSLCLDVRVLDEDGQEVEMREYVDSAENSMASDIIREEGEALDRDDMDGISGINEDNELVEMQDYDEGGYGSSDDYDDYDSDDDI